MNRVREDSRGVTGRRAALTRRGVLGMLLAAGSAVGFAACGGRERPEGGRRDTGATPYTLTWGIRTNARPEAIQPLIAEYQAARPHVTIERYEAPGSNAASIEKLAAGMAAGVPFDLVSGHIGILLIESIAILQPLEDLVKRDRFDVGKYNKDYLESVCRYRGQLYALPYAYGFNVSAVAYNRSLFASAGAKTPSHDWNKPWPWDEYREAMKRLTKSEGGRLVQVGAASFGSWITTVPLLWGTRWLTPDYRTITCDSPEMIHAYERFDELLFKDRVLAQSQIGRAHV